MAEWPGAMMRTGAASQPDCPGRPPTPQMEVGPVCQLPAALIPRWPILMGTYLDRLAGPHPYTNLYTGPFSVIYLS